MSLVINTNVSSLNAQNNLSKSQSALAQATQRLSSGLKINSAADNAAGFAISMRYTTQIGGLKQASANASDAINLAQTAGSALDQVTANLQAIRDLAVQSANATYTDADRASIDKEVQQRLAEITRIGNQTTFNGQKILDGSLGTKSFQVGADVGQVIAVNLNSDVRTSGMGAVAETSTGAIAGNGLKLGSGDLTIGGQAIIGTFTSVGDLADAITNANVTDLTASVDATGELKLTNSSTTADITITGSKAASLFSSTTVPKNDGTVDGTLVSTGVKDATKVLDFSSLGSEGLSINGTSIDLSGAKSLQDVADMINAQAGGLGVSAAVNKDGNGLNFYGQSNLSITDTQKNLFTSGSATASVSGSLANGNVQTVDNANDLIARVDVALNKVSDFAANLGAVQNRFQSTIATLSAQTTNLQASQSTIRDADFAAETANLSKAQVLQQAGISVLAQANSQPQQVLKLLQ
ncbi:MAG: flagellin [Sinobacteraceae bacterium]|nr:flagellin [Nevskiaceae bacterium]